MKRDAFTCLLNGVLVTLWEGTQNFGRTETQLHYLIFSCAAME